jgi:2'-5' RNA ligase
VNAARSGAGAPADGEDWRLFIALPVPPEARRAIDRCLAPYRERHPHARWLSAETWHLTLLFIGAMASGRAGALAAIVERAAAVGGPFDVAVDGGGGILRRGDGVAWLELGEGAERVASLGRWLAVEVGPTIEAGREAPRRAPGAHLTIARRADAELIRTLRECALGPLEAAWRVDRVALLRSHLGRGGATYEVIHEALLAGRRADAGARPGTVPDAPG